jgi:cyclophilin family peptidyl-prolyl cis-trans isomerase/HEAT repeat protein
MRGMSRLRLACVAATMVATACPSPRVLPVTPEGGDGGSGSATAPAIPTAAVPVATRAAIARAEAKRGAGVDALIDASRGGDAAARALALRGLGRVGGERARAAMAAALGDADPLVVAAAAAGLGIAAALGSEAAEPARVAATKELVAALARVSGRVRASVIEAIGRVGDPVPAAPALIDALHRGGDDAVAAAFAFGRFGRRKLTWRAGHAEVIAASTAADARLRYAATYALAREVDAENTDGAVDALAARLADAEAEVRATAITGLARRNAVAQVLQRIGPKLADPDWRVAVEAARALAGEHGSDDARVAVLAELARRVPAIDRDPRNAQVVTEGLRTIADNHPGGAVIGAAVALPVDTIHDPLARGWARCLVADIVARSTGGYTVLPTCSADLPDGYRLPLVAEVVESGAGSLAARRDALAPLLASHDGRVRGAALRALASLYKESSEADRDAVAGAIATALADRDLVVRSSALDAADALIDAIEGDGVIAGPPRLRGIDAAILARAAVEPDVEDAASALDIAGRHHLVGAADACRAGLSRHPAIARAAAGCLHTLGETGGAAPGEPLTTEPPPVDLDAVVGKRVRWTMQTTRGDVVIDLFPDVAPWGVAAIVSLTRAGSYDGLDIHRVVPDFVAQGGDPTNSGMGGPAFQLPAEPASLLDGGGFVTGGTGLADGGPDSAGSQWFVMHGRAAHLDGRYTWLGAVVSDQNVADSLLLGDRVLHARVDVQ